MKSKVFEENYNISLEEAKKLNVYSYEDLERLKNAIKGCEKTENFDLIAKLEFGFIDIELTCRPCCDNPLDYTCCIKSEDEWQNFDIFDIEMDMNNLESDSKLESIMFYKLMKLAEKYKLFWSRAN